MVTSRSLAGWVVMLALAAGGMRPAAAAGDLVGQPVPSTTIASIDKKDMTPAGARGRYLLISFSDRKSRNEGIAWAKANLRKFLDVDNISLYNVIAPGSIFLASRSSVVDRVRRDVKKVASDIRSGLTPEQQERFDQLDIRYHVDFDRKFTSQFGVPSNRVSLVLVDPDGIVRLKEDQVSGHAVERILALVSGGQPAGRAFRAVTTQKSAKQRDD